MKPQAPDSHRNFKFEFRITLTYFVFGFLWILFSDKLLVLLLSDSSLITDFQTIKGSFFIVVTSALLYVLVKRHMQKLRIAESQRIENESHYRALFHNNLSVILLINSSTGSIEDANQTACNYYGWSHAQMCKKNIAEIITSEIELIKLSLGDEVAERHNHFEFQNRLASGEVRDVEVYTGPIRLRNRTLIYSHIFDITERKRQEEQLFESEFRFNKLYENGPFGMVIADKEYRFKKANQAFCTITGYSEAELQEITFKDVSHPDDLLRDIPNFRKLMDKEISVYKTDIRYIRKDGQIIWGALTITATYDSEGQFLYNLAIIEDITRRKQAEEQIVNLNKDLENRIAERTSQLLDSNKELESFAYSVSHDLRAPLRHVIAFAEKLESELKDRDDPEIIRLTGKIKNSASKMSRLIDELLTYSRLGRTDLKTIKISLNTMIDDIIKEAADTINNRKIEWDVSLLPVVSADPTLIKLVLENLILNSIKFTGNKKNAIIKIGYEEKNKEEFVFYIKDNGAGFKMEYSSKLFGVFQRLHTTEEFEGTGIGLATVRRIITRHGGSVWAEGAENEGASFFFTLRK